MNREQIEARRAELKIERDQIQAKLNGIKLALREAKQRVYATGEYTDREQFRKMEAADRGAGRRLLAIASEFGELKRFERELNESEGQSFERAFINAARRILDRQTFRVLMDEAKEEMEDDDLDEEEVA